MIWNVPNTLTLGRVALAVGCFAALSLHGYLIALVLFVVASVTDFVDGWWARRFDQKTRFGRIADPFADKLLVCGVLIYLAAEAGSQIAPWMAVAIVARELLVTMLRSEVEVSGGDFSARLAGKLKMVLQCAACLMSLWLLHAGQSAASSPAWLPDATYWTAAATVVLTLYSGWGYVALAAGMLTADREAA
ncbi:CDP-diacylglycerol--glycerol-3-phosphate 3-phosphatidyltransferase [Pirellulimonas nuda]|uniref:CDP-diacylglycerol--glycerol-3-phosphate 3-phosphatidyltransferase n=1 Tax=Pirellulimonas nuda TaxID=2528009 RepID=UPI0018D2BE5E|nr:CDP-diacylglycerol--glycerol-3-phosphate 3-phosphatidyltransferase [Pirellulimonas nuda]